MRRWFSILLFCIATSAYGATENFTTWAETDTGGYLAPSGTSLVATSVPRNQICYVYKNYGASYWNGDFSVNFQFVPGAVSHTSTDSFLGLCAFTDALYNWYHLSVNGGAGVTPVYSRDTTGYKLFLWMVKSGSEWYAFSDNIYVSLGTTYYVTFSRDYDGGTYEKGLYTLTVCTGNYYGQSGASLVGQETLDAPSAASTDFQYVLTGLSKMNGGVQTASGTISNLDLSGAPSEDPPSKVTGAYPPRRHERCVSLGHRLLVGGGGRGQLRCLLRSDFRRHQRLLHRQPDGDELRPESCLRLRLPLAHRRQ